jgi:hypothetical protein
VHDNYTCIFINFPHSSNPFIIRQSILYEQYFSYFSFLILFMFYLISVHTISLVFFLFLRYLILYLCMVFFLVIFPNCLLIYCISAWYFSYLSFFIVCLFTFSECYFYYLFFEILFLFYTISVHVMLHIFSFSVTEINLFCFTFVQNILSIFLCLFCICFISFLFKKLPLPLITITYIYSECTAFLLLLFFISAPISFNFCT